MKLLVLFAFLLSPFFPAAGQDINALIIEGNRIEAIPDEMGAFHKFREVLKIQPLNIYALSKCSELCSRIAKRQTNITIRDDYYLAAKTYAGIALKINPNSSEANCAMAMMLGRSSMAKSGKDKIQNAREVKKYVDLALKNDPQNFKAWHILGRWHYEISNLSVFERTAVKILYGGVPPASIKESIAAFEKVKTIAPGFVLNYLEMAKAYKHDDKKEKAIAYLKAMLTLPNKTEDDASIKDQGRDLIKEWE